MIALNTPHDDGHAPSPNFASASEDAAIARTALRRMDAEGLMARGCVVMIRFERLRERLGERCWGHVRGKVRALVEQRLERRRRMGREGVWISETELVLAVPADNIDIIQGASMRMLMCVYGGIQMGWSSADVDVRLVTELRGDEIACVRLDPTAIVRGDPAAFVLD